MIDRFLRAVQRRSPELQALRGQQQTKGPLLLTPGSPVAFCYRCAFLCRELGNPALFVCADEHHAHELTAMLRTLLGGDCRFFPARDLDLYAVASRSYEWDQLRIEVLSALQAGTVQAVVTTLEALEQYLPAPAEFAKRCITLSSGQVTDPEALCRRLGELGYQRCDLVEGVGQFARRGDLLDVYSPGYDEPLRIEWFDDTIDLIAPFDLITQRRGDSLPQVRLLPARELLLTPQLRQTLLSRIDTLLSKKDHPLTATLREAKEALEQEMLPAAADRFGLLRSPASLLDYLPQETPLFWWEESALLDSQQALDQRYAQLMEDLLEEGRYNADLGALTFSLTRLQRLCEGHPTVVCCTFPPAQSIFSPKAVFPCTERELAGFANATVLEEDVREQQKAGRQVLILASTETRCHRLVELLAQHNIRCLAAEQAGDDQTDGCFVACGQLPAGLLCADGNLAILCESAALQDKSIAPRRVQRAKADKHTRIRSYSDLSPGDFIVHQNYGIGRFLGVERVLMEGVTKDYLKIAYQGSDVLYVPCNQLDLVSKYIGADEGKVKLNKMGGAEWTKTRQRVKSSLQELAKDLIELYAARSKAPGYAFSPDDDLQREFESRFEYDETEDQLRCAEEIKQDMQKPAPMDRLLCGDVGFGKTEVAMRAIFKCASEGKQCALLVPTTLLARQHYATLQRRMEGYPLTIRLMSRYTTKREQAQILEELHSGRCDIVIGTHRLIQPDVHFAALGLVVVDEEHRFGVSHKEALKKLANGVDCLTLSATPIPRTLNMAMSGLRDLSVMEEPPRDRQPVSTYVCEYSDTLLSDAIRQELRRGGQCFLLHHRIDNIDTMAARIHRLVPEARIACAHGKMTESQIAPIMDQVISGKVDVLVCTTIIESGIDIPNVNTLIVPEADRLGLAQLYQLRGRVGRSARRAYAYLFFTPGKVLTEDAQKRLGAIRAFTEFGSGMRIAMRDLEIRGAGSLLGTHQHGHLQAVGYDLYLKLLQDAVEEESGTSEQKRVECAVDLFIDAYLPQEYVPASAMRIALYQRIADVRSEEEAADVLDELCDRFGEPPLCVRNLITIAKLRNRACALLIREIAQQGETIRLLPSDLSPAQFAALSSAFGRRIRFEPGEQPTCFISLKKDQTPLALMTQLLDLLEQAKNDVNL